MKYDRVDLVGEGANGHANILIAKNKVPVQRTVVRKAMGSVKCNKCHMMNQKGADKCKFCGSSDLAKTRIDIVKTVTNPGQSKTTKQKAAPKNDDATNAGQYTFEDQQYDQDNGENGEALGDAVERNSVNKGWFEEEVSKSENGEDVDSVDNEKSEAQMEGEDSDDDIEALAETKPVGVKRERGGGFQNTATNASDSTMATHKSRFFGDSFGKKRKFKKEKPGLNSFDYGDQGSQQVAESAEQMYRAGFQPTKEATTRMDSTRSDALNKARRGRKSNREGLDVMENGNDGIYTSPGVKRNGTGTGHSKHTTKPRTSVAPPPNPLDKSRFRVVRKNTQNENADLASLEALNVGVKMAENLGILIRKNRPDLFETVLKDTVEALNAFFGEWSAGSTVTKSKNTEGLAEDVAERVLAVIAKASPQSEMSDEASEGEDADDMDGVATNSVGKLKTSTRANKNEKVEEVVGKNKVFKTAGGQDPYAGLHPIVKSQLQELADFRELQEQEVYLKKAADLKYLPGFDQEKIAKQLRNAYDEGQEEGDYLYQTLAAASNGQKDSVVFKQFGMPGSGSMTDNDPMARAKAYADSAIQKGADGKTTEQLQVDYMRLHPEEFYQEAKR